MSYWAKVCDKCKTANHASRVFCGKCGGLLPETKTETGEVPIAALGNNAPQQQPPATTKPADTITAPGRQTDTGEPQVMRCRIVDLDIEFWTMVNLMVKFAFASIPALIVITVLIMFVIAALGAVGYGLQAN